MHDLMVLVGTMITATMQTMVLLLLLLLPQAIRSQ
jgi:hypothetical protein